MAIKVKNINADILQQSREQIGLSIEDVSKKVKKISELEEGLKEPTINQLNILANLYGTLGLSNFYIFYHLILHLYMKVLYH